MRAERDEVIRGFSQSDLSTLGFLRNYRQQPLFSLPPPRDHPPALFSGGEKGGKRARARAAARRSLWVLTFLSSNRGENSRSVSPRDEKLPPSSSL